MSKTKKKKCVKKQIKPDKSKSNVTKKSTVNKKTKKRVVNNEKQIKNGGKSVKRDKNGRIVAGSGGLPGCGRPEGSLSGIRVGQLQQAILAVEHSQSKVKGNGKTWLEHQIIKSYSDTSLAIAILGRLYPSLKAIEQVSFIDDSISEEQMSEIRKKLKERFKE